MERHSMTEKEMQKYIEKTDQYRGDFTDTIQVMNGSMQEITICV